VQDQIREWSDRQGRPDCMADAREKPMPTAARKVAYYQIATGENFTDRHNQEARQSLALNLLPR
jgi:hypothetical protein